MVRVQFRNGRFLLSVLNVWLRYCSTSRKVAGSIPGGVFGIFHWHNPGSGVDSASNRDEYQEYVLGGKGGRCVGLTTLRPPFVDFLEIREPELSGTHRGSPLSTLIDLTFIWEYSNRKWNLIRITYFVMFF